MKLWVGQEKEGNCFNTLTLFIGSPTITFNDIKNSAKQYLVEQIYFGAGICSKINKKVVNECLKFYQNRDMIITLETDINHLHELKEFIKNNKAQFIITTTNKNFSLLNKIVRWNTQIKIQSLNGDKFVAVTDLMSFDKANVKILKGKMYKGDKVIL